MEETWRSLPTAFREGIVECPFGAPSVFVRKNEVLWRLPTMLQLVASRQDPVRMNDVGGIVAALT